MRFAFIAKHRSIWPVAWLCSALDVSRSGFHAWLNRSPSARSRYDEALLVEIDRSFKSSDRTYGTRRVWHDILAEGLSCGLHRIERLMRENGLRARPRRRGLPKDAGERLVASVSHNILDRAFEASAPNQKWVADFTYIWTAQGWLYVAAVVDLFSRRAPTPSSWRSGGEASPTVCCIIPIRAANIRASSSSGSWPTMASPAR